MKYCDKSECQDGWVFDSVDQKMVKCPYCAEIRNMQLKTGVSTDEGTVSLSEQLGFRRIFTGLEVDGGQIFGEYTWKHLDTDVKQALIESIRAQTSSLAAGRKPSTSVLIYLGSKADIELTGYLYLALAYKGGLSVHPFINPYRLRKAKLNDEEYDKLINADVVLATFSPSIREDAYQIEDLVRTRSLEGKATFVLLSDGVGLNSLIQRFCSFEGYNLNQPLYMGIPNLTKGDDDEAKVRRVNKAITNGNKYLSTNTPEITLEEIAKNSNIPKMTVEEIYGSDSRKRMRKW